MLLKTLSIIFISAALSNIAFAQRGRTSPSTQETMTQSAASLQQIDKQLAELRQQFETTNKAHTRAQQLANQAQDRVRAAQQAYDRAQSAYDKDAGGIGGWFQGEVAAETRAARDRAETALKEAREAYTAAASESARLNRDLLNTGGQINSATSSRRETATTVSELQKQLDDEAKAKANAMNRFFETFLQSQGLQGSFATLAQQLGGSEAAMARLNGRLDNAAIGVYMKEKMKALLNDKDTFCTAKNYCDGKGSAVSDSAMNKLFSGGRGVASGSGRGGNMGGGSNTGGNMGGGTGRQ